MARVNVPDYNTFVDFPDDTPADVMEKAMLEAFPAKDFSKVSFKQGPTSTTGIATPRQQEEAQSLREAVTGKEVARPRRSAVPELRNAPPKNFFEKGVDAVRGALSPYHDTESMDPGAIASASISMDAQRNIVPAKTITAEGMSVNIPARSMARDEFVDMINPQGKGIRTAEKFISGTGQGVKGVATGALGFAQALGSEAAGDAANAIQADSLNSPADESLAGELGSGFGSLLTFLVPSMGVNKVASLIAKISPKAAKFAATGTMTAFEAATEGGNVFREMQAGGATEEEASKAATKTFLANLPLNFITNKAAFFPDHEAKGVVKQALNSALPEGLQEGSQEYISQRSQPGKEVSGTAILKSAAIGALTGGAVGAVKGSISSDHDMLSTSPAAEPAMPAAEPQAAAQPSVDPLDAHMEANPQQPLPAPVAEQPKPEAIPEPAPRDVPVNTVFKQPDGSTIKILAKRAKEGGYVLNTTTTTADGQSQTVSSHDPVSGHDVLAAIEQHRPSPVAAPVEVQAEAAAPQELTRQAWTEAQPVEVAATAPEIVSELDQAAHESAASPTNETPVPTQAQAEAGNYKKGHVNIQGLNIAIENPQGSKRSGEDADGKPWETEMQDHYGYIKGTVGKDKDHIDVFVKPGLTPETTGEKFFVVDQVDPKTGELDEHKIMLGYDSKEAAQEAYLRNYDQTGADRIGAITETTSADFKEWLKHGDTQGGFVPVNKKEPIAPAPVQEQVTSPSPSLTLEEIGAKGMKHDANTKGEVIILKDGKNIAQQDRKTGMWRVYEGGLSAKNMVGDNFTMREAADELKGMREVEAPEAQAERETFVQVSAELESKTGVEKFKGKSFSSVSDFQEYLKQVYPSVHNIGAKKEEVVAAVEIAAGKGGKKVLTQQRKEILAAFQEDINRLREVYGDLNGDTEATGAYDTAAETLAADETADQVSAFDFFDNIIKENQRERGNESQNKGRDDEATTGEAREGGEAVAEKPAKDPAEEVTPSFKKTEAGDQGVLLKGATELGKGKNPKAKGVAGVEDLELFSEPKERAAEKSQGGFGFDTGGYAERTSPTRVTTQTFLELPEMVKLYKLINEGKLPKLMERMGNALGRLTHNKTGEADIKLRKDLFAGPQIAAESLKPAEARQQWDAWQKTVQDANPDADIIFRQKYNRKTSKIDFKAYKRDPNYALKIFAHEIGHFVDYLPDYLVRGRGNILGHIAALKKYAGQTLEMYPNAPGKTLSPEDMTRLKAEALDDATMEAGAVTETITREVPKYSEAGITPEMITDIWNGMADARTNNPDLYKFIAKMSDAEKKSVVVKAMKGLVHESLKHLGGKRQVGTETITETVTRYSKPTAAEVKARLDELVQEEIATRRLYEKTRITDELKKLTQIWKPFTVGKDAYTKYRHSASELYADAVSVLFNEPQLLKDVAPTFYKAFFYYMGERPTFKEAYKAITRLSKDPWALGAERYEDEMEMYERGAEKTEQIRKAQPVHEKIYDTMMRSLVDRNHDVLKDLPKTKGGDRARFMLEEIPYLGGEVENYARKVEAVKAKLEKSGLTINDFSAFLLARHIIENRSDVANAQGKTAVTEKAKLEYMKELHGAEKMRLLEKAADEFKQARAHILKRMEESEIVTEDLMAKINERQHYAHIDVQKYMDTKFGDGTSSSAGWKKLVEGTLSDVNNVYVATVLQDMAILRMAKINESKRALTDVFTGTGLAVTAEMKWDKNFGGKRPVDPGGEKALLTVMVKGKPVYFVVDKHVADTYKYSPVKAMAIGRVAGYVQGFFRDILVSKNPAWMLRNVYRDMKGTIKNNSEVAWWNPMDRLRLLREYKRAFTEVRADIMKGERSADIEMMHNEHMLNAERMYSGREQSFDNELERIAVEFQFGEQESGNVAIKRIRQVYNYLDKLGKISEQTSKVGGMKYLRSKGVTGDELAHKVRTLVGTPDYKRQGTLQQLSNNIAMFSNVGKEGTRSAYSAFKTDPLSYAFKTIESNILPKLMLGLAAAGALGDDLKELALAIPSWDRRSYSVIPVPARLIQWAKEAGLIGQGANAYLRLPQDYEGAFWGALTYDITQGDAKGVGKDVLSAQPYKLHPMLALVVDWGQYLSGAQPYDSFRQKDVLTREQQQYGEVQGLFNKKSLAGMGVHTYGMLGLGNIYKLDNKEFPKDQTAFERLLKITPVNAIGSYLQVNDAGRQEQLVKLIRDGRNEKSIQSYEIGDAINEGVREGRTGTRDMVQVFKGLISEGKIDRKADFGRFRARYMRAIDQKRYGIKPTSKSEAKALSESQ